MRKQQTQTCRRGGFTLIEVLLVLAILGVIAVMVVPNLLGRQKKANIDATKQSIHNVEKASDFYAIDHDGVHPQSLELLLQPGEDTAGTPKAPYLTETPLDAWKQPLHYEPPQEANAKPRIWSAGPNQQPGDADDISNMDHLNNKSRL